MKVALLTRSVLPALFALLVMTAPGAAQTITKLDSVLEPVLEHEKVPGIAAAVMRGDTLIAYGAAGVQEAGEDDPVSFASRWHIGSCTKAMVATMIGQLVHEGTFGIQWETTVLDVLPDLKGTIDPAYENVTIKQLLTHTAGLPAYKHPNEEEQALLDSLTGSSREQRRQFLEKVMSQPPAYEPGTTFEYSNAGYGIVAALVEETMDEQWDRVLYRRFGAGLAMSSASTGWPRSDARPFQPVGHWRRDGACVPQTAEEGYGIHPALAPAGDLHCTIAELGRFTGLHLTGLAGPGESWFSAAVIKQMHQPVLENYSMGWVSRDVGGRKVEWHNGSAGTFTTWMTLDPERNIAVVVTTNCGDSESACEFVTKELLHRFAPVQGNSGTYGP